MQLTVFGNGTLILMQQYNHMDSIKSTQVIRVGNCVAPLAHVVVSPIAFCTGSTFSFGHWRKHLVEMLWFNTII